MWGRRYYRVKQVNVVKRILQRFDDRGQTFLRYDFAANAFYSRAIILQIPESICNNQ